MTDSLRDIDLWFVDLDACATALDAMEAEVPRLANADLTRIATGTTATDMRARRAAHIALRILIERAFGSSWRQVPYRLAGSGKPELAGLPGAFSLAHAGGLGLIGLTSRGPIGVDIEPLRVPHANAERRQSIEAAASALADGRPLPSGPPDTRFLQAWVRLESVAKAEMGGIGRLLTGLGIIGGGGSGHVRLAELAARFEVVDVAAPPGFVAAVAVGKGVQAPPAQTFPSDARAIAALLT